MKLRNWGMGGYCPRPWVNIRIYLGMIDHYINRNESQYFMKLLLMSSGSLFYKLALNTTYVFVNFNGSKKDSTKLHLFTSIYQQVDFIYN